MESLLREYLTLVLEKIRSKKFNVQEFKRLETPEQVMEYAQSRLKLLGKGTSRAVFVLNSRQVVKVALGKKGLAQNEAEADAFTNPKSKPIIAKIVVADDDFKWLVSELVNPLKNDAEFESLAGMSLSTLRSAVSNAKANKMTTPAAPNALDGAAKKRVPAQSGLNSEFVEAVVSFATENKMLWGDILKLDSWGKAADGRLVLFDYGATEQIFRQYYRPSVWDSLRQQKKPKATTSHTAKTSDGAATTSR